MGIENSTFGIFFNKTAGCALGIVQKAVQILPGKINSHLEVLKIRDFSVWNRSHSSIQNYIELWYIYLFFIGKSIIQQILNLSQLSIVPKSVFYSNRRAKEL